MCEYCDQQFTRRYTLKRHVLRLHSYERPMHLCPLCNHAFRSLRMYNLHKKTHKPTTSFILQNQAFNNRCQKFSKIFDQEDNRVTSVLQAFTSVYSELKKLLEYQFLEKKSYRCSLILNIRFVQVDENMTVTDQEQIFARSKSAQINSKRDIRMLIREAKRETDLRVEDFVSHGSGWILNNIISFDIEIGRTKPLNGGCLRTRNEICSIKKVSELYNLLPTTIENINEENDDIYEKELELNEEDQACFLYAVAAYFTPKKNRNNKKKLLKVMERKGFNINVSLPVKVNSISKFEKDNEHLDIKINVLQAEYTRDKYGNPKIDVYPLRTSPLLKKKHIITLLLYQTRAFSDDLEEDEEEIFATTTNSHYLFVNDIDAFLTNYNKQTKQSTKLFFCLNCLNGFHRKSTLQKHKHYCLQHKPCVIKAPDKDSNKIKFNNFNNKFKSRYIGFFDFEAMLTKPKTKCDTCFTQKGMNMCIHKATVEQDQKPISYSIIITDLDKKVIFNKYYTGVDCMDSFLETLINEIEPLVLEKMQVYKPLIMSKEEENTYKKAVNCHICEKKFNFENDMENGLGYKVRDHDHLTGEFLGAAHNICNLKREEDTKIPLFCHNFSGYDSHFIVKALDKENSNVEITKLRGLPYNTEKFRTLEINNFVLLDSAAFLGAKLETLAQNLQQTKNFKYGILNQMKLYKKHEKRKKKLLLRKGVFPYEYLSKKSVLKEKRLPPRKKFYSKLKNEHISREEYLHAKKVFKAFKCDTFQEYMELYCRLDVALLAEIVCKFRDEIYTDTALDIW